MNISSRNSKTVNAEPLDRLKGIHGELKNVVVTLDQVIIESLLILDIMSQKMFKDSPKLPIIEEDQEDHLLDHLKAIEVSHQEILRNK